MITNWEKIRTDFPILKREINDQSLIYGQCGDDPKAETSD